MIERDARAHHHPRQVKHLQCARHREDKTGADHISKQRQRDKAHAFPAGCAVEFRRLVHIGGDVVESCDKNDEIEADILPKHRKQHRKEVILLALPVDVCGGDAEVLQQLIEHAAVVEENEVKEQAQRRRADDDREKIQRAKELLPDADAVYDQREHERGTHLKHQRAADQQQRVFHRNAHVRVVPKFHIVGKPRVIRPGCLGAQSADGKKTVDDVLNEWII
ncbi:hypothetical protein SDC9_137124 [bioreactor metagenome]|uniref:Uncharacterized protein n=1 Tax=bioreactor metagenome TaxID=1076179 RepID=A0A645DLQ1_9ZZZZ